MTRVLLTGGSGFIAAHVLESLLTRGHSVVTTVRSQEKADKIKQAYPDLGKDKLDFAIVEDIAQEGAFDKAVISDPPFESVIHTASPFHFNVTDTKKDLLDPAINGTTGILKAIKKSAPTVKHVVITSSFAAILNGSKLPNWPEHTYTEEDWNPITEEQALTNPAEGYRASKTFAERAAWDFVRDEKPNFTISTVNPPMVFGPVVNYLNSLDSLNTSNQRIRDFAQGKAKNGLPNSGVYLWIDVRDLALIHVRQIEVPEAAGKRFFATAGYFSNKEIADAIRNNFPEYKDNLPAADAPGDGDYPNGSTESLHKYDNSRVVKTLGIKFRTIEESVVDLVKSLKAVGLPPCLLLEHQNPPDLHNLITAPPPMSSWDYIAKLVCIGDSGTGKSSLVIRLCEGRFSPHHDVTIGVEFGSRIVPVGPPNYVAPPKPTLSSHPSGSSPTSADADADAADPSPEPPGLPAPPVTNPKPKPVVQKHMKLSLWDTAGQETYKSVTRSYFRGASGALLVFDISRRPTFAHVQDWLADLRAIAEADIVVVLVGNKSDLAAGEENKREVTVAEAEEWAAKNGVLEYVETSAKSGEGVERAFARVAERIYENIEAGKYDLYDRRSGVKGPGTGQQGRVKFGGDANKAAAGGCC
ncbi:hypothetical protein V502_03337 [Pseudogymnoascus sp. VKM F-4520 (FW-2644)]|nr:hypothetical protein V502_03337 [Pseudogymnoascus sp. VKM F-4520 (FW-2644)]